MDETTKNALISKPGFQNKFWLAEAPEVYRGLENVFRFYRNAGILSVSASDFPDKNTGVLRMGKTVTVNLNTLRKTPDVLQALIDLLQQQQLSG